MMFTTVISPDNESNSIVVFEEMEGTIVKLQGTLCPGTDIDWTYNLCHFLFEEENEVSLSLSVFQCTTARPCLSLYINRKIFTYNSVLKSSWPPQKLLHT